MQGVKTALNTKPENPIGQKRPNIPPDIDNRQSTVGKLVAHLSFYGCYIYNFNTKKSTTKNILFYVHISAYM